jgi:chromosome segregation ATPase
MTNFFSRIATTFVTLSQQGRELEELKTTVAQINERLEAVIRENATLKQEVADTWAFVRSVEQERDQAKREHQEISERMNWQHDALQARDKRILELEEANADLSRRLEDSIQRSNTFASQLAETAGKLSGIEHSYGNLQSLHADALHARDTAEADVVLQAQENEKLRQAVASLTFERNTAQTLLDQIKATLSSVAALAHPQQAA